MHYLKDQKFFRRKEWGMHITYGKIAFVSGTPASTLDLLERDYNPAATAEGVVIIDYGDFKNTLEGSNKEDMDTSFIANAFIKVEEESNDSICLIAFTH